MSFMIPSATALVTYLKDWTGSKDDDEIKQAIFQAELMMRNIELPANRSNPYDPQFIAVADSNGQIQIPADMYKPILFFKQGNPGGAANSSLGPWIVYDRIGDRDMIADSMIAQLYLQPVNIPAVIRGKFAEVGNIYQFLPLVAEGDMINMYYYRAWPLLFTPIVDDAGDPTGQVVETNAVLQSFPEGYVYGALHCYYVKRHSPEDAAVYLQKYTDAYNNVEDQNSLGKWSGGHNRLYSVFQPRVSRQYQIK